MARLGGEDCTGSSEDGGGADEGGGAEVRGRADTFKDLGEGGEGGRVGVGAGEGMAGNC